jgi:predicted small integral membrane protein
MNTTNFAFRIAKLIVVGGVGMLCLLVTINNINDYGANFKFVLHVMKMDDGLPGTHLVYRSIRQEAIYHFSFVLIIVMEAVTAFCCLKGGWQMYRHLKMTAIDFHESKRWAVYGLIFGIFIWFIIFQVIAGEWFAMWQNATWNGLYSADRILTFITISLLILLQREDELPSSSGDAIL